MSTRFRSWLPLAGASALMAMSVLPGVVAAPRLMWSFWGAATILAAWSIGLLVLARRAGRDLTVVVDLRPQHYVQAAAQLAVLLYWGWFWPVVYESLPLVAAQIMFAYSVDMLVVWSRRNTYALGFGPLPVVLSTSLFLWFKVDWFYLQFLLLAFGFAAKNIVQWQRMGRRVHIFNPSAFPLALFSIALIATGASDITWGAEIATTLNRAPWMYGVIVLVAIPGQLLFGVATMTMSAVVTMYLFGLAYFAWSGTYYFVDSYVPIAVFLGMHLLFTDPSTAPRTDGGRVLYGALYAMSVALLYTLLEGLGVPTFYDKLLSVPLLNVMIVLLDRVTVRTQLPFARATRPESDRALQRPRVITVGCWIVLFLSMTSVQAVGDTHRGQYVTFWLDACEEGRSRACVHAARLLSAYCVGGSGWACNEYGVLLQPARRPERARQEFRRACDFGFAVGCSNFALPSSGLPQRAPPVASDYRVILRRKGGVVSLGPTALRHLACGQGFVSSC